MRRFTCDCGNILFFGSFRCLVCGSPAGYDPRRGVMARPGPGTALKQCENGLRYSICNWVLPVDAPHKFCVACRLNRTIPDLTSDRNRLLWGRMEMAKRRLLYTLLRLGLTVPPQGTTENAADGLAFDIVSTLSDPAVTTGHLQGVITVNLEEADDTYRQINRQQLGENSRTLLGHFRHESAHYLWRRYLSDLAWDDPLRLAFRERFGNESLDYSVALQAHYQHGPPSGWEQNFITAYAASHPWEDWAETWGHYLEITDGLETCESLGLDVRHLTVPLVMLPGGAGALPSALPQDYAADGVFLAWLQRWMCLSTAVNEIAHSLGEATLYPFVISSGAARKLRLAHHFAGVWGRGGAGVAQG
jgi:hypothetical protein